MSHIDLVSLLVRDYDEAIDFYVGRVGFELVEDRPETSSVTGEPKRWVVVRPPGGRTGLLLARASDDDQRATVGRQMAGRVGLFLHTDDFEAAHRRMTGAGVRFAEAPRQEPYGTVAVWEDLYGNRWDLLQPAGEGAGAAEAAQAGGAGDREAAWRFDPHIGETLITAEAIAAKVVELGRRITDDHRGRTPLLVTVLKGSMVFVADLMRAITGPVELDVLAVSSYGEATKSSGVVKIIKDLDRDVAGRDVILVEDIVDSGLTMRYLLERLSSQNPASLKVCSLLIRDGGQEAAVPIDYEGFRLPAAAFVIGYGLDAGQLHRNLPFIATYLP